MKRIRVAVVGVALVAIGLSGQAAPFTAGNLVIYRVGDGVASLVNKGNPVFLDEYATNGTLVQSIMLPTNAVGASYPLIASGTATSEGLVTRSADGRYLVFMGYGTTMGGSSLSGTTSINVPRVVGRADVNGNLDTTTALTNFASANNPRSAASDNGTNLWVAGAGSVASAPGGVGYTVLGSQSSTAVSTSSVNNVIQLGIFGGQLYVSSQKATQFRLGTVGTGLPTSATTIVSLPGCPTNTGSPDAFVLVNLGGGAGPDTLYVADDTPGGIYKYSLVGGNWTSNGVITASAVCGLTASLEAVGGTTNVHLFGTTGTNSVSGGYLYAFSDTTGYNGNLGAASAAVIATNALKMAFRGIAWAPVETVDYRILAFSTAGNNITLTWRAAGGTTNAVEAQADLMATAFTNISGPIAVSGSGSVITNYTEFQGATNAMRYYRIHQLP